MTPKKKSRLTIFQTNTLVLAFAIALLPLCAVTPGAECTVDWFAEDTNTQGDWYFNPIGSPIGVYGSYAYILAGGERYEAVIGVPIDDFSVPEGFDLQNESTWNLLAGYGWTSAQIAGLIHMKNDPSIQTPTYLDEYWTQSPDVTYHVKGTQICPQQRPKGLLNTVGDTTYTRAACWFAGSANYPGPITLTIELESGSYLLSLYILDYDGTSRRETIQVGLGGVVYVTKEVNYVFNDGLYENFFVHLANPASVEVTITNTAGANAVVSGVFVSSTTISPANPVQDEIYWVSEDSSTGGDWTGTYGDIGYIKCAWDVPGTKIAYTSGWDPNYDHAAGMTYTADTALYAWTAKQPWSDECIQYPVFEWQWHEGFHITQTQPREVYYPIGDGAGNHWRLACWDDGGERCKPVNGYMEFYLTFPGGTYLLSLYAYDYERSSRQSQEYRIYDETGTTLLASKQVSGTAFDEGIYEIFKVQAPPEGCTIIVRVWNDAGHPNPNANVLLSGIFVDKLEEERADISGIKFFDADKNGQFDNNDWPIEAWQIQLFDADNNDTNAIATALTDANGYYIFEDLECGTYIVREVLPEGWTNTTPIEQTVELCTGQDYQDNDSNEALCGTVSIPLIAGQFFDVGSLEITYDEPNLIATYSTTDDYYLTETQLYVGTEPPATSAPGQFPYKHPNLDPNTTHTDEYVISLADLNNVNDCTQMLYIAAHATIFGESWPDNNQPGTETAWAGGSSETAWANPPGWTQFDQGWGGYFPYVPCCEEPPVSKVQVDFGNWAPIALGPEGLTIGFWKTNVAKNLGYLTGKTKVDANDIQQFLNNISDTYGGSYAFLYDLDLMEAYTILGIPDASIMMQKAQAHILALLLTAEYYGDDYKNAVVYLPDIGQGSDFNGDMLGAIDYVLELYDDGKYNAAKNLADALNNIPEDGYICVEPVEY